MGYLDIIPPPGTLCSYCTKSSYRNQHSFNQKNIDKVDIMYIMDIYNVDGVENEYNNKQFKQPTYL